MQADAETIQKQYEDNVQESAAPDMALEAKIKEGVDAEIAKLYEALPKEKKTAVDKAIAALDKVHEKLRGKVKTFRRSGTHGLVNNIDKNYTYQDVLKKIGETPICYLTGETIDLEKTGTYQLDHIVPTSKGGSNNLDNLAICKKEVNFAKGDLTLNEFYELCEKVIRYKNKIDK